VQIIMEKLLSGIDLSYEEAEEMMEVMMGGSMQPSQVAAFLTAMRIKGEKVHELSACAKVMRKKAKTLTISYPTLDTCGTGGDRSGTFNISTAVGFVCSAAGISVAKHGNRSISSQSGSADVLEALGANIQLEQNKAEELLEKYGFTFLFAPLFHPAMQNVATIRKELGYRTLFNILGPLCNPATVCYQLMGVYDANLAPTFAQILHDLGIQRALIVHGMDGLDEMTITDATYVTELREGIIKSFYVHPLEYGIPIATSAMLKGGDAKHNAKIITHLLQGEKSPCLDIVALNSGAAFYIAGITKSIKEGIHYAYELLYKGIPYKKMQGYITATREVPS